MEKELVLPIPGTSETTLLMRSLRLLFSPDSFFLLLLAGSDTASTMLKELVPELLLTYWFWVCW